MAGSALKKIESINERLGTNEDEAISQAMSTCRRLIDAVADDVFPARDEPYDLNGQKRDVKQNNVLNRINAYLHSVGVTGGRATRLRRSLEDIYGRVSKGVHDDVNGHEARYLFLTDVRHAWRGTDAFGIISRVIFGRKRQMSLTF
jgi:hypothetical protein